MSQGSMDIIDRSQEDPIDRNPHQYMVDAFTHAFKENLHSKDLEDAIIVREKNYFYTSTNTLLEDILEVGRPKKVYGENKGDLDFAVIYLDSRDIEHYEFKDTEKTAERKAKSRTDYGPEEQVARAFESLELTNDVFGTDWSYEHEILFAEDYDLIFDYHPPEFVGEQLCTDQVYRRAKESQEFELLDKSLFEGDFWGKKIEEVRDFR